MILLGAVCFIVFVVMAVYMDNSIRKNVYASVLWILMIASFVYEFSSPIEYVVMDSYIASQLELDSDSVLRFDKPMNIEIGKQTSTRPFTLIDLGKEIRISKVEE